MSAYQLQYSKRAARNPKRQRVFLQGPKNRKVFKLLISDNIIMKGYALILCALLGILASACSIAEQPSLALMASSSSLVFAVDGEGNDLLAKDPLVFEVSTGTSDLQMLSNDRERRNGLSRLRFEATEREEEEDRLDRVKSRNWRVVLDDEEREGIDAVLDEKGELQAWEEPEPSHDMYGAIVRFGYG